MSLPAFPAWLSWLLLLAVIWLGIQIMLLQGRMAVNRHGIKTRQELEAAYTKGLLDRDAYERLKDKVK